MLRDTEYQPQNEVTRFTDKYGEEQIIHCPKGRALRLYKGVGTPSSKLNRAAAQLMGAMIKARRIELGLSMKELCQRAGFVDVNPKQRIWGIENATRGNGIRMGTLYALSMALDCEVDELLPKVDAVLELANVNVENIETII